jgi:phage tail tape-measure protein
MEIEMKTLIKTGAVALTALSLAACTSTQNVERNALGGAAAGAAVGAGVGAVSGDVKVGEGAAAGAVVGGVIGAIRGNNKDKQIQGGTTSAPVLDKTTRYQDANGRYYYYERGTSRTFYENGQFRSN